MKIVCDDKIPFLRGVFEPYAEVVYLPGAAICAADVRDADALVVRTRTRCGRALLEGSSVRVIASATIGYDHIDTAWCSEHGIEWANAPGCNSGSVAQYVGAALGVLARRFGLDLSALTLGVVGVGHVGSKVARLAQALGMRVLLNDPPRALAEGPFLSVPGLDSPAPHNDLDKLIAGADIITLHVPLTSETRHLFDFSRIESMRSDQILINTSRGEVICGDALKAALKGGRLKAAVLDVWENEPDIDPELAELAEIATPHIAGYSTDGKAAGTTAAVRVLARALGIPELCDWSVRLPVAAGNDADVMPDSPSRVMPDNGPVMPDSPGRVMPDLIGHLYRPYDILRDSAALKSDLSSFEHLRESYPIRRE